MCEVIENLDLNVFEDNRTFWSKIKPLFSEKHITVANKIIIVENNIIFSDNEIVAEKLNNFFIDLFKQKQGEC